MDLLVVLKEWTLWLLTWGCIIWVVGWCIYSFPIGLDDSDLNAKNRSGMKIYTDYKTGLQYLGTSDGGLTPRLNADGTQIRGSK